MIILSKDQNKSWEEIQQILIANGINNVHIQEVTTKRKEIGEVSKIIKESLVNSYNESWLKEKTLALGTFLMNTGWDRDVFEIKVEKERPEDEYSSYEIGITIDSHTNKIYGIESDIAYFIEEHLLEERHEYDFLEGTIGDEKNWKMKMPKKVGTYKIMGT